MSFKQKLKSILATTTDPNEIAKEFLEHGIKHEALSGFYRSLKNFEDEMGRQAKFMAGAKRAGACGTVEQDLVKTVLLAFDRLLKSGEDFRAQAKKVLGV